MFNLITMELYEKIIHKCIFSLRNLDSVKKVLRNIQRHL